jgi:deoxyribonuclease-4
MSGKPRFGVGGYPPAFERSPYRRHRVDIVRWLADLGLDAFELQMTYGPRTTPDRCAEYRRAAEAVGCALSVHASYYIVFTSPDREKVRRSADTLMRTFELCDLLGARSVVLHPGPLHGGGSDAALTRFLDHVGETLSRCGPLPTTLFVETAGKLGQLGSVAEIFAICRALPELQPCIDFGHVHAYTQGGLAVPGALDALLEQVTAHLAVDANRRVHFHYTPIDFGPRGERSHKKLDDLVPGPTPVPGLPMLYGPRPEPVARALSLLPGDFTVISETRNSQEQGALALRAAYLAGGRGADEGQSPVP